MLLFALVPAAVAAAGVSKPSRSWAAPEIKAVTAAGLMDATDVASFRADDPLTAQTLEDVAFEVKQRYAPPPETEPEPVDPLPPVVVDPRETISTTTAT
ncbi:MAG: hypothetical protein QOF43_213, partial [Gaiellaceae bacterium]|nr:hypothetical protein [Gaiellaceae bacterium]